MYLVREREVNSQSIIYKYILYRYVLCRYVFIYTYYIHIHIYNIYILLYIYICIYIYILLYIVIYTVLTSNAIDKAKFKTKLEVEYYSTGASDRSFYPLFNKTFDHLETLLTICRPKKALSAESLCRSLVPSPQSKCPKRTFMLPQKNHLSVSNMLSKPLKYFMENEN